ncbi:glycoside hydrolase family 128 protein [Peniophora sp. CONT]|nr:glycoside hydrolase family 128 protein [Peniophora sp. CONT]
MLALAPAFLSLSLCISLVQAGKRGLAWPWYNAPLDPSVFAGNGQVVAIYDWETYQPPSTNGSGGLEFIGMQGCPDCDSSPLSALQSRAAEQGWTTVFSVNEPDIPGSSSMSPSDAATWYKTNINPLTIRKALPAVTSSTSCGEGLDWLSQMITACAGGCQYDYINLHWYGNTFEDFQSHIQTARAMYPSTNIVITEFALENPTNGASDQTAFFNQAFPWLDSQDYVTLYFPFVATSPSLAQANSDGAAVDTSSCLYDDGGALSSVGKLLA